VSPAQIQLNIPGAALGDLRVSYSPSTPALKALIGPCLGLLSAEEKKESISLICVFSAASAHLSNARASFG
jgi:hypothetical protein